MERVKVNHILNKYIIRTYNIISKSIIVSNIIKLKTSNEVYTFKSSIKCEKTLPKEKNKIDIWDESIMNGSFPNCSLSQKKELTIVDLFCGSGGFTEGVKSGLKQLGINSKVLAGCDLDEKALKIYDLNRVNKTDLHKVLTLLFRKEEIPHLDLFNAFNNLYKILLIY